MLFIVNVNSKHLFNILPQLSLGTIYDNCHSHNKLKSLHYFFPLVSILKETSDHLKESHPRFFEGSKS